MEERLQQLEPALHRDHESGVAGALELPTGCQVSDGRNGWLNGDAASRCVPLCKPIEVPLLG
jgi:hypothetical protein